METSNKVEQVSEKGGAVFDELGGKIFIYL